MIKNLIKKQYGQQKKDPSNKKTSDWRFRYKTKKVYMARIFEGENDLNI